MAPDANPRGHESPATSEDEDRFAGISGALADAIDRAVPAWIERLVVERMHRWKGSVDAEVVEAARTAGAEARDEVMPRLRALLATDIDEQRANPLALLRDATHHAHAVLAEAGLPSVPRDQFSVRSFPEDTYGLVPATWSDVDPSLHEIGITWGAAKAFVHKARRRDAERA